ncbi:uncharacterized protein LOC144497013 isoform X2 [Mustelus asterias]
MEGKLFRCDVCDEDFMTSLNLLRHQMIHTEEKPFRCDVCDKAFTRSFHLLSHQRTHRGEKPFKCDVCDKSFIWSSSLSEHQRLHTGDKDKLFGCDVCTMTFNRNSHLLSHQRIHTGERPFTCEVKLAHNTQERSLTGGQVPYINTMNDTQVSMVPSEGDGGELAAVSEIPKRVDEEGTEVNTSHQCGMAAAVEEREDCQEGKMSDLEGSIDELKLNIVVVKEELCDALAAVVEGGRSEPSGDEEPVALGAEALPSPRAHGQHQAQTAGKDHEDDLKFLKRLYQEQVQSTESYQATSNLLQQTLTEFKTDVSQNLQRNNEILQQQNEVLRQQNEIQNQHLQRNNEVLQQQNEILCQLLQRSNETLNEMRQILSQIVVPSPSGQQQPSAETSAARHASDTGEVTLLG